MKRYIKYIGIFGLLILLFIGILVLSASIPKQAIQKGAEESADYFNHHDLFEQIVPQKNQTKLDYYADCILLNIAYSIDTEQPLKSIMSDKYYRSNTQSVNADYTEAVTQGKEANTSYARYWHGSICYIRPLLMITNIKGIYLMNAVVLIGLLSIIIGLLIKRRNGVLLKALLMAVLLTNSLIVPLCIEYSTTYLVTCIVLIIVLIRRNMTEQDFFYLFFITGMVTVFLDFLTTETLTLTLPLVFILSLWKEEGNLKTFKENSLFVLKSALVWLTGYALTWIFKWCLSTLILHENIFAQAASSIDERTVGLGHNNLLLQMPQAIIKNISLIFPMNLTQNRLGSIFILLMVSFILLGICLIYGKQKNEKGYTILLCSIGMIPYIRYMILSSHASMHNFFTYRAQFTLIVVISYLVIKKLQTCKIN